MSNSSASKDIMYVVVPVYNASRTLNQLSERLINALENFKDYKIILVNDFSTDDSFVIIKKLNVKNNKIIGIELEQNYGQQSAIQCVLYDIITIYYCAFS